MTQPSEQSHPSVPDQTLRQEIQTRHPGIAGDIQGAINTLRKIQQIAGVAPASGRSGRLPGDAASAGADEGEDKSGALLAPSETFGRYQIVRLLGKGAMGAVYLAYDPQLERYVALKTPFLGDNPIIIERFFREARATAQLRSPYICTIYDVGQISGIHFISMAFIDGQPLEKAIAEGQFKDSREIADVTRKIARGLQKAHEQGIIHRDLKPGNIMLDADREPIVMDFGLARRVDDDIKLTTPGKIMGTPAYMSPEQVEGDPKNIGPPTDIYSLGVVLYQMLTHQLPFQGSLTSVLRQIGTQEPPKPSSVVATVARDSQLERICLKMMAKLPAGRFETMAAAAEALEQAFPREAPVVAKPSAFQKFRSAFGKMFGRQSGEKEPAKPAAPPPKKTSAPSAPPRPAKDLVDATQMTAASEAVSIPAGDATQMTAASDALAKVDVTQMTVDSDAAPAAPVDATQAVDGRQKPDDDANNATQMTTGF
jgi:serine/threonine protein kinase